MQHARNASPFENPELETNDPVNVVIAYEDFETGTHARRIYDALVQNLDGQFQFTSQMWKFDVLDLPKLQQVAVRDALGADIIVVSCHGHADLPHSVKSWIESWLNGPGHARALVALFAAPDEPASATRNVSNYLAGVARCAGLEFFAEPDDWPGNPLPASRFSLPWTSPVNGVVLPSISGTFQHDPTFPRWGINE